MRRWPVSANKPSRFFKLSSLVPVCILSNNFTLDALFRLRPILDRLMQLFISALFLQKTILLLKPVTLNFLFLQVWGRVVIIVVWPTFKSILCFEYHWVVCREKPSKWIFLDLPLSFFKYRLSLSSHFSLRCSHVRFAISNYGSLRS
jgi:hypothetical protein